MRDNKRLFLKFFENLISTLVRNEKKIYITLFAIAIFLWVSFAFDFINLKKILAFTIFVIIGGSFKYMISKFRIFVEFTPVVFFSVIIAHYMGFFWVILYIFAANIIPSFLAGHGLTAGSVPHWFWIFLFSIITIPFEVTNIFVRILLPLVYFAGCILLEQFVKGGLNGWRWTSAVANLAINFYFFLKLTEFFVNITI